MLVLLLLPVAWGHADGRLEGIDLQVLASGAVSVETSFGLIWAEGDEPPTWHCHEAITAPGVPITPRYAASEDGVILGLVPDTAQSREAGQGLYRSTDGCDWVPVTGLDERTLAELAFDPNDSAHVLVTTADPGEAADNGIWRSEDGGETFASVLSLAPRSFRSVRFSAAGGAWASAVWTATDQAWIYTSPDGQTWTEHEVPLRDLDGSLQDVDVVAVSPTDPQTAWVVAGPFGNDVLLRTTDGGASFEQVFHVTGDILDATIDASGGVWLAVSGRDYYVAPDGEDFAKVDAAPRGMGLTRGSDDVWLAIDARSSGHIAAQVVDDIITPRQHLSALELASCPVDSHAAEFCDPIWPELAARMPFAPGADTGTVQEDTGEPDTGPSAAAPSGTRCGCGGKGTAAVVLPLVLLGVGRRRS